MDIGGRYLLAEDEDTIYVAFMGTKQRRDLVVNAAVLQEPFFAVNPNREADKGGVSSLYKIKAHSACHC